MMALNCVGIWGVVLLALTGCQLSQPVQQTVRTDAAQYITLSCTGTPSCQFERVNNWQSSALARYVTASNAQVSSLDHVLIQARLKPNIPSQPMLQQRLKLPAAQYEVVVQFFPISKDRAETFHVIHAFQAQQNYLFKMYRKRDVSAGSLLKVSTPDPLCVDLIQAEKVIRRFCRPFAAVTGTGEYVEQKL